MIYSEQAPTAPRRIRIRRIRVAGLLVASVAIAAALGHHSPGSLSSMGSSPSSSGERAGPLGEAGGDVPDGTTAYDDVPGVAKLDPALLGALRRAASDAEGEGVKLIVDSGWRSPAYQEQLLREAVSKYGSEEQAGRWVATPDRSAHVSGDAVDVGPPQAAAWLSRHPAQYGLCRIYANEPWHFELRPTAISEGCPPLYADPTQDPKMRK